MLKNKVFITAVGISLVIAIVYNISYFTNKKKARTHKQRSPAVNTVLPPLPVDDEIRKAAKDTPLAALIDPSSEVVDKVKLIALKNKPWGRNPFLTLEEELALHTMHLKGDEGKGEKVTTINGILIGQNHRVAIMDHTVVTEGDWMGVEQVVKIEKTKAILAVGKKRRAVIMDEPSITIAVDENKDSEEEDET